ncbi:hypothetical protein L596_009597 [Steinernema carpocapsae]|uniref:Uncharacterized protein n=1 Tax=Steinernema carpocapsae TaxID=34508 RepID=A0A4U5PFT6_STECR|nr:hypothetical protein L596_009597 [Steinernema carpocapsae]
MVNQGNIYLFCAPARIKRLFICQRSCRQSDQLSSLSKIPKSFFAFANTIKRDDSLKTGLTALIAQFYASLFAYSTVRTWHLTISFVLRT